MKMNSKLFGNEHWKPVGLGTEPLFEIKNKNHVTTSGYFDKPLD